MRSALLAVVVCSVAFPAAFGVPRTSAPQSTGPTPLILEKNEGEKRVRRPIEGSKPAASEFFLKIDPRNGGSKHLVFGVEEMAAGGVIPMHKHLEQDEILYLENGRAHVTLGKREQDVSGGATIFIPQGMWISVKNIGTDSIRLIFVFSSPGYENYMRCTSVPDGQPVLPMSLKERDRCMPAGHVMYR